MSHLADSTPLKSHSSQLPGYWGMMSGINGIFDFVKFIDVWVWCQELVLTLHLSILSTVQIKNPLKDS